jgi:hypothetical protein
MFTSKHLFFQTLSFNQIPRRHITVDRNLNITDVRFSNLIRLSFPYHTVPTQCSKQGKGEEEFALIFYYITLPCTIYATVTQSNFKLKYHLQWRHVPFIICIPLVLCWSNFYKRGVILLRKPSLQNLRSL